MLGSALTRAVERTDGWEFFSAAAIPWSDGPAAVRGAAASGARALIAAADGGEWTILWAAGAVVTASTSDDIEAELRVLTAALEGMRESLSPHADAGTLFYASSAGGVYAGSSAPPFTEATEPVPLAPYGTFKLRAESIVEEFARSAGIASLSGRIANLYGPGQRLDKLQGLVSHIALARLTPRPASIYVPLDTLRDYIFVDDCADLILSAMRRLATTRGTVTKILASGQSTSIAALLGHFRALSKSRPRVILGSSPLGASQALDLRLRSAVWSDLDQYRATTLPEGIGATIADLELTLRERGAR
jgi:UDP-glucose 4-epimerase